MWPRTLVRTAGNPRHLVQRGNQGSPCFFADEDYLVYLDCVKEGAERHRCAVHAYVLMPDHVQLLASADIEGRLALMMRSASGRYVEYVNYIYQRNGAFWEQGLKSAPIESERYLLACYRYIETTPVRACMVASPADYRWSSFDHHAGSREDAVIRDHSSYLKLGATQRERQLAYREWFRQPLDERAPAEITTSTNCGFARDGDRFEDRIERLAARVRPRSSGRLGATEHATAAA